MTGNERKSHHGSGIGHGFRHAAERRGGRRGRARKAAISLLVPLLALLAAPRGGAAGFNPALSEVSINPGYLWILATDTVGTTTAEVGPFLVTLGASLPWRFWDPFFAEAMLDFWGTYYKVSALRAVPSAYETDKAFLVLAALLSLQIGNRWTVVEGLDLGYALGFDFLFRLPLDYNGGTTSPAERTASIAPAAAYFYGSGRFFYPETRLFAAWRLKPEFGMTFSLRALWPLFHAWDGENLPFYDQLQLAGTLGFTIYLK